MSGDPQLATEEAARYVAHHYVPSQTPSDYRFLFDLVAQRFGHATLEELLTIEARKRPDTIAALVEIPRLIQILTWVALQRDAPAARLLIALYRVDKRRTAINLEELADGLDEEMELSSGPYRQSFEQRRGAELEIVVERRRRNRNHNPHPAIGQYLDDRLAIVERQLTRRDGVADDKGLPRWGNPLTGDERRARRRRPRWPAAGREPCF